MSINFMVYMYGRSILAIAGDSFCVVAADTRQSHGYLINTRTSPKAYQLSDNAVLATSGFHADGFAFVREMGTQLKVKRPVCCFYFKQS